jgi:hypothetical protein
LGKKNYDGDGTVGFIYALGVIGAAIYFITKATGFLSGVLGFLKALVWPAYVVYAVLMLAGI